MTKIFPQPNFNQAPLSALRESQTLTLSLPQSSSDGARILLGQFNEKVPTLHIYSNSSSPPLDVEIIDLILSRIPLDQFNKNLPVLPSNFFLHCSLLSGLGYKPQLSAVFRISSVTFCCQEHDLYYNNLVPGLLCSFSKCQNNHSSAQLFYKV